MAQRIVGVDLGTYSVKAVTLAPKSRATPGRPVSRTAFDVIAVGEVEVPPPAEGEDAAATLRDRQGEALAELKRRGLVDGDLFVTGLPGDEAAMKTMVFPFNDKDKIDEALPYTLEGEIALDLDDIVYPYIHMERRDQRDPRRAKEAEVLTAFARKDAVQDVINLLHVHGIDPRHIELDALALDDLWEGIFASHEVEPTGPSLMTAGGTLIETADGAPAPAVAIVDIGHRRTSVCILREGKLVSAHTLLHGGADATRALAKEIGLSLDEAERGKRKEAFLEVAGAVAQFPEQQQISDVLKKAHAPVVRRLRQLFQAAISTSRLRIVKVVLTGGGSKVLNLDRHLGEELNIKVVRGRELNALARAANKPVGVDDVGDSAWAEFAMAFAYALAGLGNNRAPRIDFRVGPFAWKGDYDFLRERLPALGAWAAALLLVVGVGSLGQAVMLSREESALIERQLALCEQITGDKTDSTSKCIALIQERINGTGGFQVPEHSAVDTYVEISRRLPLASALKRKITEMDITNERVRLKGTTTTYEAIDTVVESLTGGQCFQLVEKGKARNINADTVEMNVTINLDCAAAPGDNKTFPPPPAPTAASMATSTSSAPAYTPPPRAQPTELMPPPPDEPAPDADNIKNNADKSSVPQLEARKERLKRLREEREARRRQLLDNPAARGSGRDRFQKAVPIRGLENNATDDEGDE